MTLRFLAIACITALTGTPAFAQRVCTLQLRPIGPLSNELVQRAIAETLQVKIGNRLLAADVQQSTKTLSVNLGNNPPAMDALENLTPVLDGFEFQKVEGSVSLENGPSACVASYSFRPIKVWRVQVSAPTEVLIDVTENAVLKQLQTPSVLPSGKPLDWAAQLQFEVHPVLEDREYRYPVTLRVSDFGKTACNQTRAEYFCHDSAQILKYLYEALPRGNSTTETLRHARAKKRIEGLTIAPRIDFELRKP
jgi:hypothetical protein